MLVDFRDPWRCKNGLAKTLGLVLWALRSQYPAGAITRMDLSGLGALQKSILQAGADLRAELATRLDTYECGRLFNRARFACVLVENRAWNAKGLFDGVPRVLGRRPV